MPDRRVLFALLVLAAAVVLVLTLAPGRDRAGGHSGPVGPAEEISRSPGPHPDVERLLDEERPWSAARRMREVLRQTTDPEPTSLLLAARAEAGWGGWARVRSLLEDRPWLDSVGAGEGWLLLGRALEADSAWAAAAEAYGRHLTAAPPGPGRRVAGLRRGALLLRLGRTREADAAFDELRAGVPQAGAWVDLLAAEALAERGDTAAVRARVQGPAGSLGPRAGLARLRAAVVTGDPDGALHLARRLASAAEGSARAAFHRQAGRLALDAGDRAGAVSDLRGAVAAAPESGFALEAARLLEELPGTTAADHLAIGAVYQRHGHHVRAVAAYRRWLDGGSGTPGQRREVESRVVRSLFAAREYAAVDAAARELARGTDDAAAEALLLTGRARYRRGERARGQATLREVADRFPGSAAGAEALFLVADLAHDAGDLETARATYRRAARGFRGHDRAGLSQMRLAGMAFVEGDPAAASSLWEEYRTAHPDGDRWLEATYWAGRAHAAAGSHERAAERFAEVRTRDPLSYYSLLAARRLGLEFGLDGLAPSPDDDPSAVERVEGWMETVDLLRDAGLAAEAEAEVGRVVAAAGESPILVYPLAEALNARGYTLQGLRLGQGLQRAGAPPSRRLLGILYAFPYRAMITAEAEERGIDPYLAAGLIRQESTFRAHVTSPVGARGLMQVMPETGRPLARAAGIGEYDPDILYHPEINVHLGMRYLAEQMRNYGGSLPSVFSAYNAGPLRVRQWSRFPEYGDDELFTERIPFRETRDYVKILTRNHAIYRALHAPAR
jgi:soluble lytic murein transglycosylase